MGMINYAKGGEGGNWVALPESTYDVRIEAVDQSTSMKGNPQLKLGVDVLDGTHAGKKVNIWYSLLPQSTWKLDKLLEVLGIERVATGEYNADGSPIMGFDDDDLIGRAVRYTVKQREYPAGSRKMTNDWGDEAASPFDVEEEAEAAPAPVVAKPVAVAAPVGDPTAAMRRRPRPAGVPQA